MKMCLKLSREAKSAAQVVSLPYLGVNHDHLRAQAQTRTWPAASRLQVSSPRRKPLY